MDPSHLDRFISFDIEDGSGHAADFPDLSRIITVPVLPVGHIAAVHEVRR